MNNKPLFVFESPLITRSGYGDWAEAIARSLLRYDKFDIILVPTRWGSCSKKNIQSNLEKDPELQALLSKFITKPLDRQPDVFCKCSIPNEAQPFGKYNICMTAGIETTLAAGTWIEGLNRMNLNIVTSNHVKNVFESANYTKRYSDGREEKIKLEKPCEVLFWGADTSKYKITTDKNEHIEKFMSKIPEKFAFLFVGQWTSNSIVADRKDIGMLIKTFVEAFRDVPKDRQPCLILKTSGATLSKIDKHDCISKLKSIYSSLGENSNNPNTYILHGELTDEEMNALYNHEKVKVHVSFSHGEGYGHPLLLASLSGKPVLATNWSGHLDFLDSKYCKLLPYELKQIPGETVNDWFIKESSWAVVNYSAASEIMKTVFNHYGAYKIKAEELAKVNAQRFSIQEMDKQFHAILDKYLPQFSVQQQIILPKLKKITLPRLNKVQPTNPPTQEEVNKTPVSENK